MLKILLISYYFPPCGGAAVQRWLRLIRQTEGSGLHFTVICPIDGIYPNLDPSLQKQIPASVKLIRTGRAHLGKLWSKVTDKPMPYGDLKTGRGDSILHRALVWIRLNLIIPDLRVFWVPAAYRTAKAELLLDQYDLVITTGPPHSTHLVGYLLKKRYKLLWVSDWRDPWVQIHYLQLNPPSRLSLMIHKHLEKLMLKQSDLALVVSRYISDSLPPGNKRILYNSVDPNEFPSYEDMTNSRSEKNSESFTIKYVGQLTAGQDIVPLLQLLDSLTEDIRFQFIGTKLSDELEAAIHSLKRLKVERKSFLSHQEAIAEMLSAQLLILLINDYPGSEGMVTTKLFEYLASRRPILCVGNTKSEASRLIDSYQAGACFEYNQLQSAGEYLQDLIRDYQKGIEHINKADLSELMQPHLLEYLQELNYSKSSH